MMILRSSPPSPFGRKVRIAISVLGFDGEVTVEPADPTNASDSVRQQNPLGKIPVLIAEDGNAYYDSRVILDYLDDRAGGGKIVPRDRARRGSRRCVCRRCATAFSMPRSSPSTKRAGASPKPTIRNGSSTRPAKSRVGLPRWKRLRRARARRLAACRPDRARLRARLSRFAFRRRLALQPSASRRLARRFRRAGAGLRRDQGHPVIG